jgi:hypothetical protein
MTCFLFLLHVFIAADGSRSSKGGSTELIFRPTEGGEVFSQLVSLCADPAILGKKLLDALASLASDATDDMTQSGREQSFLSYTVTQGTRN